MLPRTRSGDTAEARDSTRQAARKPARHHPWPRRSSLRRFHRADLRAQDSADHRVELDETVDFEGRTDLCGELHRVRNSRQESGRSKPAATDATRQATRVRLSRAARKRLVRAAVQSPGGWLTGGAWFQPVQADPIRCGRRRACSRSRARACCRSCSTRMRGPQGQRRAARCACAASPHSALRRFDRLRRLRSASGFHSNRSIQDELRLDMCARRRTFRDDASYARKVAWCKVVAALCSRERAREASEPWTVEPPPRRRSAPISRACARASPRGRRSKYRGSMSLRRSSCRPMSWRTTRRRSEWRRGTCSMAPSAGVRAQASG